MDALLTTFVAAALAEFGDKTQLLVAAFAIRYRRAGLILLGVAVAALANSLIAATGGILLADFITSQAVSLLVALALVYAGFSGLIGSKQPRMGAGWKTGAFITTTICFFLLEFGDKTQVLTLALAARFDAFALAALGAAAGVVAANAPAALLADKLPAILPMRGLRIGIGAVLLLAGFMVAISALGLV
ncbi:TMEM165/GDT1 family protein [Enterovirga sp. GCM10030262]|uniref:TMEM165/GDT1 family protein n=1 Tax=Enterovirga sp. GCM10030262 TaxID=3273391 RepID=UPI00361FB051